MKHHSVHGDPDRGPPMLEGAHHYDKGYQSDDELSHGAFPEAHMRGNRYSQLNDEIAREDKTKLVRIKRKKIS